MMNDPVAQHEALIWTDKPHVELVNNLVGRLPCLNILSVGGPRKGDLNDLADELGTSVCDDLRKMLVDQPAGFLLLTTTSAVTRDDLSFALDQGVDVLSLEPAAAQIDQALVYEKGQSPSGRLVHIPMFRLAPGFISAADPQEVLGEIHSLSITSIGSPDAGSLYARLFDAIEMVICLLGIPDQVDAALTGPLTEVPEQLRGLTGQITVNLRFADSAGVTIHVSDQGARWYRQLVAVGSEGQLLLDDLSYRLDIKKSTETELVEPRQGSIEQADLIAAQWQWMIDHHAGPVPVDARSVIATADAILLSCRTAQAESPQTLLQLHPRK